MDCSFRTTDFCMYTALRVLFAHFSCFVTKNMVNLKKVLLSGEYTKFRIFFRILLTHGKQKVQIDLFYEFIHFLDMSVLIQSFSERRI